MTASDPAIPPARSLAVLVLAAVAAAVAMAPSAAAASKHRFATFHLLSVSLPGAPHVLLAGPEFTATLRQHPSRPAACF